MDGNLPSLLGKCPFPSSSRSFCDPLPPCCLLASDLSVQIAKRGSQAGQTRTEPWPSYTCPEYLGWTLFLWSHCNSFKSVIWLFFLCQLYLLLLSSSRPCFPSLHILDVCNQIILSWAVELCDVCGTSSLCFIDASGTPRCDNPECL
jgi:hypothetical protein